MAIDTLEKHFCFPQLPIENLNSPDRVDTRLDQDSLLFVPGDNDRIEEELLGLPDFDLGLVVSLHLLAGEVLQTHRGLQSPLDAQKIGLKGCRLK